MDDPQLSQRLMLTADISLYLQMYAEEATRTSPTRAYLEAHAARILKRAAELYAASRNAQTTEVIAGAPLATVVPIAARTPLPHDYQLDN